MNTRELWYKYWRLVRIARREQMKACKDMLVYGTGVVIVDETGGARHLQPSYVFDRPIRLDEKFDPPIRCHSEISVMGACDSDLVALMMEAMPVYPIRKLGEFRGLPIFERKRKRNRGGGDFDQRGRRRR